MKLIQHYSFFILLLVLPCETTRSQEVDTTTSYFVIGFGKNTVREYPQNTKEYSLTTLGEAYLLREQELVKCIRKKSLVWADYYDREIFDIGLFSQLRKTNTNDAVKRIQNYSGGFLPIFYLDNILIAQIGSSYYGISKLTFTYKEVSLNLSELNPNYGYNNGVVAKHKFFNQLLAIEPITHPDILNASKKKSDFPDF